MSNELQSMDVLKQALVTQNQHGEALLAVIERMEEQEKRVESKIVEVKSLVEAVDKKVHIDDGEAHEIQKLVNVRSAEFAKYFLEEKGFDDPFDTNIFLAKIGQIRGVIYKRLKRKFNVTKYTHIKHTSFDDAINYLESIEYQWLTPTEVRWTQRQKDMLNDI